MVTFRGVRFVLKNGVERYWFLGVWCSLCVMAFIKDYYFYKTAPQFFYLRRMLGIGVCISRGTAAVINVSVLFLILPMCRSVYAILMRYMPSCVHPILGPFIYTPKMTHLVVAYTLILASVLHTASHFANMINFSRNYMSLIPEINMASHKGENPLVLIFSSVPGITGVLMSAIIFAISMTSLRCVRRKRFEVFTYAHHLTIIFAVLLIVHPLSGTLKGVANIDTHLPGCRTNWTSTDGDLEPIGFPEPIDDLEDYRDLDSNKFSDITMERTSFQMDIPSKNTLHHDKKMSLPVLPRVNHLKKSKMNHKNHVNCSKSLFKAFLTLEKATNIRKIKNHLVQCKNYTFLSQDLNILDTGRRNIWKTLLDDGAIDSKKIPTQHKSIGSQHNHNKIHSSPVLKDNMTNTTKQKPAKLKAMNRSRKPCVLPPVFQPIKSTSWVWVLSGSLLMAFEWFLRIVRRKGKVCILSFKNQACDMLSITLLKKGFDFKPGQFILMNCNEASWYEWHPFTVAQSQPDNKEEITLFIRTRGDWCSRMASCLNKNRIRFAGPLDPSYQDRPTSDEDTRSKFYVILPKRDVKYPSFCATPVCKTGSDSSFDQLSKETHNSEFVDSKNCGGKSRFHNSVKRLHSSKVERFFKKSRHPRLARTRSFKLKDKRNKPTAFLECLCKGDLKRTCRCNRIVQFTRTRLRLDGPFISPTEKAYSHPVFLGISGGIGITPLLSILNHIIYSSLPSPKRIHVIWVMKNLQLLESFIPSFERILHTTWAKGEEDRLEIRFHVTNRGELEGIGSSMLKKQHPTIHARVHEGRPVWSEVFELWENYYAKKKVGVFCCGPKPLCKEIRVRTKKAIRRGRNFSYHHESFG